MGKLRHRPPQPGVRGLGFPKVDGETEAQGVTKLWAGIP